MNFKKLTAAVGLTLGLLGSGAANAYVQTATDFSANYAFSNFLNNDGTFNLNFTSVTGKLEFQLPPSTPGGLDRNIVLDWGNGSGLPVFTYNGNTYTGGNVAVTGAGITQVLSLFLPTLATQLTPYINNLDVFVLNFNLTNGLNFAITDTKKTVTGDPIPTPPLTVEQALAAVSIQPGGAQILTSSVSNVTTTVGNATDVIINRVPEPTTLALLGIGAFGLMAARRRRA